MTSYSAVIEYQTLLESCPNSRSSSPRHRPVCARETCRRFSRPVSPFVASFDGSTSPEISTFITSCWSIIYLSTHRWPEIQSILSRCATILEVSLKIIKRKRVDRVMSLLLNPHQCLWIVVCWYVDQKGLATMLAAKRLAGVAPEESGGSEESRHGIHPGFETQGRCHQKFKKGVSVGPQKGLVLSNFFFLKKASYRSGWGPQSWTQEG